jgi:hypothetical protein
MEDISVEARSCMARSNGRLHMHVFKVLYVVLHCSTTRFQFDLNAMHPSHAFSNNVTIFSTCMSGVTMAR